MSSLTAPIPPNLGPACRAGNTELGTVPNYPYFSSGIVIVNGIEQGLVVVKPNLGGQ